MKHLVNQLLFEMECSSEDQALTLRHNLAGTLQQDIEKEIDAICSMYSNEADFIRIVKLELDLGRIDPLNFNRRMLETFTKEFEQVLLQEINRHTPIERKDSLMISKWDGLLHFLETGQLKWWLTKETPDFERWFMEILDEQPEKFISVLKHNVKSSSFWKRIAFQFSSDLHESLIRNLEPLGRLDKFLEGWIQQISKTFNFQTRPEFSEFLYQLVIMNAPYAKENHFFSRQILKSFIDQTNLIFENAQTIDKSEIEALCISTIEENITSFNEIQPNEETMRPIKDEQQKFHSQHGGAVLLAQFLRPFFNNLKLLEKNQWINQESQYRAIHLINYLCTGEVIGAEYNLSIEKLLCGLPMEAPVPKDVGLTKEEKEEAKALLESIIEHWSALKSSSIDGLRHAFLIRDCILTLDAQHWKIHMESKTMDVLLDKIPWGYTIIILPWNGYQIFVEW